jgi:hypothetical protein
MKWALLLIPAIWPALLPVKAQPLSVYSEFARIDVQGNVVAPETPREIISPAVVRNGFTSFQVVVQVPPSTPYFLHVGLNPENSAQVTIYRAQEGHLERMTEPVKGDATHVFWMDVWIDQNAPVRRIKVEPQLFVNGDWVVYPMEVRVQQSVVPRIATPGTNARVRLEILHDYLCDPAGSSGAKLPGTDLTQIDTVEALHSRNAGQDVDLASLLPLADRDELRKRMGGCNARAPQDPESYLSLRDLLFTPPSTKSAH